MDSLTDIEDEENFFASYDAQQASVAASPTLLAVDASEAQLPTDEELAHLNRFRRPVAWVVAALALFSFVALENHGMQRSLRSRRELVARYNAAVPTPTSGSLETVSQREPAPASALSQFSTQAESNLVTAFISITMQMCLRRVASEIPGSFQTSFTLNPSYP